MSSNNVAHISSVDKGLKMKIKRTKIPNKLDSKHEVVKTAVSVATSGVLLNTVSATASSVSKPSLGGMISTVATSRTSVSLGSNTIAASVTATLSIPSSTSLTFSLSSMSSSSSVSFASTSLTSGIASTSLVTMAVTNPTVALLKAASVAVTSDASSAAGKSPAKTLPPGAVGCDSRDGKSPKTKAAYSKKVKDNKMKPDIPVSVGSLMNAGGNSQTVVDGLTCVPVVVCTQTYNALPAPQQPPHTSFPGVTNCMLTCEPRPGDTVHMKKDNPVHDPYEFNAKVEDKIELPPKKLKLEKADCLETAMSPQPQHPASPSMIVPPLPSPSLQQQQQPQKRSVGVDVCSVGVVTEPECLGPCEPGTLVGLEGIVWKETDNGLLVVNVTWRGKTYVGTLMDATRYAWAPPRPNGCDSPVSDFESRTPKGRGKRNCRTTAQSSERLPEGRRLRKGRRGTVNSSSSCFTAPPSPAKSDISSCNNMKRKTTPNNTNSDKSKRSRSCSRGLTGVESPTPDDFIVCPEPNCHKKYKHMNGLRYHRTHAHRKSSLTDDAKDEEEDEEDEDERKKKERTTLSERAERMKAKEKLRKGEQQKHSDRDSKDSLDDDIPLKEIAIKVSGQNSHRVDTACTDKDKTEDESSVSISELSSCVASLVTISNTVSTSEATFVKPNINSPEILVSQSTDSVAQVDETHAMEVLPCTVPLVPSVTAAGSPQTVASSSSSSLPVITCVMSPVQQVSSAITMSAVSRISHISHANSPQGVRATHIVPVIASSSIQTTAATALLAMTLSTDRQSSSKGSGFLKTVTSVRPIVPAPLPQTAGMPSPHLQNSTSQSSPHAHGPPLKPIQPKPTIMGDYSVVSPALSDLSREKSRKVKKKKEKDSSGNIVSSHQKPTLKVQTPTRELSNTLSELITQDDVYKIDRSAVIRNSTPSKPFDTCSPTSDISQSPFHLCVDSPARHSPYSDTAHSSGPRLVIPPSSLAVSSHMDNKSTISEDVHSPAYSDISDANDSRSPVQQDSPKKDPSMKLDDHLIGPPHLTADGHPLSQHYNNMFYYGAAQNYLPHGIHPHMASPTLSKGAIKSEYIEDTRAAGSDDNMQGKKEEARSIQDSELHQKSLINYYAHLHNISPAAVQYQLSFPGLNPAALDSPYAMLAQQTLAAGQKRLLQQESAVKLDDGSSRTTAGLPSGSHPIGLDCEVGRKCKSGFGVLDTSLEQKGINDAKGPSQGDKNNEKLQTLKDNVELKPTGPHHHQSGLPPQDQHNYQLLKQQNDILRAQMYQQQKFKAYESQRQEKRKGPPELTRVVSRHVPGRATPDTHSDSFRKDMYSNRQDLKRDSPDSKRFDVKEEITQPKAIGSLHEVSRSRAAGQTGPLNGPPTSTVSSVPQSLQSQLTSSLPMSLVTPLPGAGAAFPYNPYYPHFRPVQLDTMYRSLNPHIIGYTAGPAPGYIHPEQLGYRMSTVDPDRKVTDSDPQRGELPSMVAAPGYPPVHKIHELHDKGRPSPGVHSPGPTKSAGGDRLNSPSPAAPTSVSDKVKEKQREYPSSPPTQRHVHTHHHTYVVGVYPPNASFGELLSSP
ncbi:unnamed protein product [Candidula unifasciata]|uniref:C2H2-type domain-containing protein n=1 Tax=Candidula unifasciata TaxID=100452 RepID=A0A8S3ZZP6_9EUPU|nr:unnamed protein product [Candidula unifasciata]